MAALITTIRAWSFTQKLSAFGIACAVPITAWAFMAGVRGLPIGLWAFLTPVLFTAQWVFFATKREVMRDIMRLAGIGALVGVLMYGVSAAQVGHTPRVWPMLGVAWTIMCDIAPLVLTARLLSDWLMQRLRVGEGVSARRFVARFGGELGPLLLWLPLVMLSMNVHRAQVVLPVEDNGVWAKHKHERIEFAGTGGTKLAGLWFEHSRNAGAVMLIHGLGAEKTQFLPLVDEFYAMGYHVFTYDQRNHGESGGLTCTLGAAEADDAVLAWRVLLERTQGMNAPRIVLGISLGGAAAQLAAPQLEKLDGLMLDSTFADVRDLAERSIPVIGGPTVAVISALRLDGVMTGARCLAVKPEDAAQDPRQRCSVLIIHSTQDPLIPYGQAERLLAAYGSRARLVRFDTPNHAQTAFSNSDDYKLALNHWVAGLGTPRE